MRTNQDVIVGLLGFLVKQEKLSKNPLLKVKKAAGDKVRKRRALPVDLLQSLLDAAKARPLHEALTVHRGARKGQQVAQVKPESRQHWEHLGHEHALLYMTALHTGFRYSELAALEVCHLNLDAPDPHVFLPGAKTKNGKDACLSLRNDLVTELRTWITESGRQGKDKLFNLGPYTQISKLLQKDLAFAGIPYRDELGRYFDFHSLRKCTGTYLRKRGIDPALSMKYMRHSDIRLTMETYNDDLMMDLKEATAAIPALTIRR